ncbi:ABC transporter ATP-binding protein [Olsenella profusa]|uniref:ABC transporter ATP-binding protein n=1 Tax=Olsenella profusa TaxID=138595 RepID=A0ABS2F2R2_9ACTN|nr:ABC transporter ATP-binding protein [Olsenella profusa]MBM6774852.1 ABC transporter ATP-binding protein [Olsenella profusa]
MDQDALFRTRYGSFRRFFSMLGKARLPYLWIVGYLVVSAVIANVGVSTTEYSAALFAGNVGLWTVVLPYLFYTVLALVIGSVSGLVRDLCQARIDRNLRRMVWRKAVHLPLSFYDANNPKELLSRITTDVTSISSLIMLVVLPIFTTAYSTSLILGRISSYNGRLMLSLVVVLPVNVILAFVIGRLRFGVADLINRRTAQLTASIAERTNNMLLIKSMGTEEKEAAEGEARMKASYDAEVTDLWVRGLSLPVYAIATSLQSVVIILAGRAFYGAGALDLAQWIAYYGFAVQLTNILSTYCSNWSEFKGAQGALDRVSQIMEEPEEQLEKGTDVAHLVGGIALRDVAFAYDGSEPLFEGLSVDIPAGKITAVVGPSGSGKSTLLNLIDRLYPLDAGSITIDGRDISELALRGLRRSVGYVTQECVLYAGTIRQNLLYGLDRTPDDEELDRAMEAVGMLDFVREQPGGYDAPVGESGGSLSGGQRQRLSVARALLQRPDCLLLDEATAALDIDGKDRVWKSVHELMAGKTVVYVAHDAQTLRNAEFVVVLEGGRVTAFGERDDVLRESAFCREMMESGSEVSR